MKKVIPIILSLFILFGSISPVNAIAVDATDYKSTEVFKDELVGILNNSENNSGVMLSEATVDDTVTRIIVKSDEILPELNSVAYINGYKDLHILDFVNELDALNAIEYYKDLECVEYAELDGILKETVVDEGVLVESTVKYPTGVQSDLFGYTSARNEAATTYAVDIAVIDSGAQSDHDFLQGRVEPTGFNSVTQGGTCYDDRGHGTQVSGIIAANTNSNVKIKPYKVLDNTGEGSVSQVVLGIDAAIEDGVDIINLSMTMSGINETLHEAVQRAWANGIIVVVAAGNSGNDLATTSYSPACFDEVITVMSCDNDRYLSSFSNYGGPADYAAPGENVLSPTINNQYKISSGTSLAAPFICAAVAHELSKTLYTNETTIRESFDEKTKFCWGKGAAKCLYPGTEITHSTTTVKPSFSFPASTFVGSMTLELSCTTENSTIFYTTNGTTYNEYTSPITLTSTTTVTAFAICDGKEKSSSVSVKYTKVDGNIEDFVLDDNDYLIKYNGELTSVSVPNFVNGRTVLGVSEGAFSDSPQVTAITFEKTMLSVGDRAFLGCTNLTSIQALGATYIGESAFEGCTGLTTVKFSAAKTIGANAFKDCSSLKTATVAAVTSIGEYAFYGTTSLSSFTANNLTAVPAYAFTNSGITGVGLSRTTEIGECAFQNCSKLKTCSLSNVIKISQCAFKDCVALTSFSAAKATNVGSAAFSGCNLLSSATLSKVSKLGDSVFDNCSSLKNLTLNYATTVGDYCFNNCSGLLTVSLNNVKNLGEYVFNGCSALTTLSMDYLTEIDLNIVAGCSSLSSLSINAVTILNTDGNIMFDYIPSITSFSANALTSIPNNFFKDCTLLTTVSLEAVTSIGSRAFENTAITKINCPKATDIGEYAFVNMSEVEYIYLAAMQTFPVSAFSLSEKVVGINFNSVKYMPTGFLCSDVFPNIYMFNANNLISIPANMFKNCADLEEIGFSSVQYVGANAFDGCELIYEIDFPNVISVGDNAFNGTDLAYLYLDSLVNYNPNMYGDSKPIIWSIDLHSVTDLKGDTFVDAIQLQDINLNAIPAIPANCFEGLTSLKEVQALKSQTVGENAFKGCTSLENVDITSATTIGKDAFKGCSALVEFIADSVTEIDVGIFDGCVNIETISLNSVITLPTECSFSTLTLLQNFSADSVKSVPAGLFENCTSLNNISFENAVSIGDSAFKNTAVTEVFFNKLEIIGDYAFYGAHIYEFDFSNVKEVGAHAFYKNTLANISSETITKIGEGAFEGINNLTWIDLPNVKDIPAQAFKDCVNLQTVDLNVITSIGDEAFMNTNITGLGISGIFDVGDRAFYGCNFILDDWYFIHRIRSWGSQAFYGSSFKTDNDRYYDSTCPLPHLEYVSENAFDGIDMQGIFILENVEVLNDLPENCTFLIGSDCNSTTITETTSTIYSPAGTNASKYCIANGLNYVELNEKTGIRQDVSDYVYVDDDISFFAFGFNTEYVWYGANKDDLSDAVEITDTEWAIPIANYDEIDESYRYYYCVATSNENGNILNIRSSICKNIFKSVCGKSDVSRLVFDDEVIESDYLDGKTLLDTLYIDYENTVIKPSYTSGDFTSYGTGTVFEVYNGDVKEFELVLLMNGDVNGDGYVDALDCQRINMAVTGVKPIDETTEQAFYWAADSNVDGIIDVNDYQTVVNKMCS